GAAAGARDAGDERFGRGGVAEIVDGDAVALARREAAGGGADAAAAAGDEQDLAAHSAAAPGARSVLPHSRRNVASISRRTCTACSLSSAATSLQRKAAPA